jgi:hypothetical protein
VDKYQGADKPKPTLELAEPYPCCGEIEDHKENCPNFVPREPGDE